MNPYPKIHTIWKRDERGKIIEGAYARPEFAYLSGCEWEWTEKVDGTNVRVIRTGGRWTFKGKTDEAQLPATLFEFLQRHFEKWVAPATGDDDLVIYGEGFGGRIQKVGPRYGADPCLVVFDVRVGKWWLRREDVDQVAARYGLSVIPVVGAGTLPEAWEYVQMPRYSSVAMDTTLEAEGLVMRPTVRLHGEDGERLIAKIKARDTLFLTEAT